MSSNIPSGPEVRALLAGLSYAQVKEVAELSSVPFTTLWNIRKSPAANPGIDTVRKFIRHAKRMKSAEPAKA